MPKLKLCSFDLLSSHLLYKLTKLQCLPDHDSLYRNTGRSCSHLFPSRVRKSHSTARQFKFIVLEGLQSGIDVR